MGRVVAEISTSLDGFVAGPNPSLEEPLGEGGELLHTWVTRLASWRERHGLALSYESARVALCSRTARVTPLSGTSPISSKSTSDTLALCRAASLTSTSCGRA